MEYTDRTIFYEFWYGFHAMIGLIGPGMSIGYSSVALPVLTSNNTSAIGSNYFYGHPEFATWFASIIAIANLIGSLSSGIIMKFGRKFSMIIVGVLCALGWLIITTSYSIPQLLIGRFITGFSTGLVSTPTVVYLAEIALPQHRIIITTCSNLTLAMGIMIIYLLGFLIPNNWRLIAGISILIPTIAATCVATFIPESPVWLLHKGRENEARKSLFKLRGLNIETQEFNDEFSKMVDYSRKKKNDHEKINSIFENIDIIEANKVSEKSFDSSAPSTEISSSSSSSSASSIISCFLKKIRNILRIVKKPEVWKPFVILNMYFFFQQFCGIYTITAYAVDFISQSGVIADPFLITAFIGILQIISATLLVLMSTRMGTRPISLISGIGMVISLAVLAIYLKFIKGDHENYTEIPLIALFIFVLTGQFGFAAIPWSMIGELFPTKYVNILGPLTTCFAGFFNFITLQTYPLLIKSIGMITTLCIYCFISLIATVFIALNLPETRGQQKNEIEAKFRRK